MLTCRSIVLVLALALVGCGDQRAQVDVTSSAPPPRAPLPRPAEITGTGVVVEPAQLYELCRESYGLRGLFVARGLGAGVASSLGLPVTVAEHVDESAPLRIAAARVDGQDVWLVGVALRAPDKAILAATGGESAPFRRETKDGVDRLIPVHEGGGFALAVAGNRLVVASNARALDVAAPFLGDPSSTSFVPKPGDGPRFEGALPVAALDGARRALPVSLPVAATPLPERWMSALAKVDTLTATIRVDASGVSVDADATLPDDLGAVAGGSPAALLALPADAEAAATLWVDATDRRADARSVASLLSGAAGDRQIAKATDALVALADARGPETSLAFESSTRGPMVYGSLELADPAAADAALGALVRAFEEGADDAAGPDTKDASPAKTADAGGGKGATPPRATVSAKKTVLERVGDAYRLRVSIGAGASASVVVRLDGNRAAVAAAVDAEAALSKITDSKDPLPRLAEVAAVREAVARLGDPVSAVIYVDPERLARDRPRGDDGGRSVFVLGLTLAGTRMSVRAFADARAARALLPR
jgi:hypothetical protein